MIDLHTPYVYRLSTSNASNLALVGGFSFDKSANFPSSYSSLDIFQCDSDYYLTKYTNNSSTRLQGSINSTMNESAYAYTTSQQIEKLKEANFLSDDVYFNSAWTSFYFRVKLSNVNTDSNSPHSWFYADADFRNIEFSDSPQFSSCTNVSAPVRVSAGGYNVLLTPIISVEETSGDQGGSADFTPVVSSILMIPATILVCCFFFIIYRMFMNRKVRG